MSRALQLTFFSLATVLCLPNYSSAQEPPQAELNEVHSWMFENEVTQNPVRVACRPVTSKVELAKQNAEWAAIWSEAKNCSQYNCTCESGTENCSNRCTTDLGQLGIIPMPIVRVSCDSNQSCIGDVSECKKSGCCTGNQDCASTGCCSDDATCCKAGACEDCTMCSAAPAFDVAEVNGCTDVTTLLCMTLEGKSMSDMSARKAIHHAMAMAFNQGKAETQIEMERLKSKHVKEMADLRGKTLQMSTQIRTVDDVRNWMAPLYSNQNRALSQIQLMSHTTNALYRTLNLLEKQMSTNRSEKTPARKFTNPHVSYSPQVEDVYDLRRQVSQLKEQLRTLQASRSEHVQPAQHLQPIFKSKFALEPMETYPSVDWPANSNEYRR